MLHSYSEAGESPRWGCVRGQLFSPAPCCSWHQGPSSGTWGLQLPPPCPPPGKNNPHPAYWPGTWGQIPGALLWGQEGFTISDHKCMYICVSLCPLLGDSSVGCSHLAPPSVPRQCPRFGSGLLPSPPEPPPPNPMSQRQEPLVPIQIYFARITLLVQPGKEG